MKTNKKFMISFALITLVLIPAINSHVNALDEKQSSSKVGGERDYQEIPGPHLMVNIIGIDKKGNEILYPHYVEFPIKPGNVLTKKDIIKYIDWTLDNAAYNKFKTVEIAPNSKIEVSYFSKKEKRVVTESFPITDKGFVIPDLSEDLKNPSFNLITNVVIEEKNIN